MDAEAVEALRARARAQFPQLEGGEGTSTSKAPLIFMDNAAGRCVCAAPNDDFGHELGL